MNTPHTPASSSIHYQIAACPLGNILLAYSEQGVCALSFGNAENDLLHGLQKRFKDTPIVFDQHKHTWLTSLLDYFKKPQANFNLPLDIQGTDFQKNVWQALQKIPFAQTTNYQTLAAQIGKPTASRAVAQACASNPVAVLIPCHRVLRSNGELSGYRWGIERKQWLLSAEQN